MEQGYNSSQPNEGAGGGGSSLLNDENRRGVWWSIPSRAFNLFDTPDRTVLLRRLSAYLIMGMRSLVSFLQAAFILFTFRPVGFLFAVALSILGFYFAAWGLGIIIEAKRRRMVFGLALVSGISFSSHLSCLCRVCLVSRVLPRDAPSPVHD